MFEGTIPALITPFKGDTGLSPEVDYEALEEFVEWQISCGVDGLCSCGTTGESATLTAEERLKVIARTIEIANGRVPVIAGTGSNCTKDTIDQTRAVKELGADAALVVVPYYNKPTQDGIVAHFTAVAREGGLPTIMYSVPGRTVVDISIESYIKLAKEPGIVATKDATDSCTRLLKLADAVSDRMTLLAGDDTIVFFLMSLGGKGVISASANVIPTEMKAIVDYAASGDFLNAAEAQQVALPMIDVLFSEPNPIPAKAALKILGKIPSDAVRFPLTSAKETTIAAIKKNFCL